MIKIEKTEVFGWEHAIRGMRNPMNSWDKSDTKTTHIPEMSRLDYSGNVVEMIPEHDAVVVTHKDEEWCGIGKNDIDLMKKLVKAGNDHRKFMRMIIVYVDVTAPLYWWKEFDTYKVGTVANSCSTMHKIHAKEFTLDDFSYEHLIIDEDTSTNYIGVLDFVVDSLNRARVKYLETKNKKYWWQMIQLLPSSYNQRRTIQLNYEVLLNMYHARKNHKLDEWHEFCKWIETLPYFKEICLGGESDE